MDLLWACNGFGFVCFDVGVLARFNLLCWVGMIACGSGFGICLRFVWVSRDCLTGLCVYCY